MTAYLKKKRHIQHPVYIKFGVELQARFLDRFPILLKGQVLFFIILATAERLFLPSVHGLVILVLTAVLVALEIGVRRYYRKFAKKTLGFLYGGVTFGIASLTGSCLYTLLINGPRQVYHYQILMLCLYVLVMGTAMVFSFHLRPIFSLFLGVPLVFIAIPLGLRFGIGSFRVLLLLFPFLGWGLLSFSAAMVEHFCYREFRKKNIAENRRNLAIKQLDHMKGTNVALRENLRSLEKEIEERKLVEKNLEQVAAFDDLTAVYNRRAGVELLKEALHYSIRKQSPLTIVFLDLDRLKIVNDNFGHSVGDTYLREVVFLLRKHLRKSDSLSRFGGDEFLVILTDCNEEEARAIFDRVEEDMRLMNLKERSYPVSFSYGFAEAKNEDEKDYRRLIALADERMYLNKQEKRLKPPRIGEV